MKTMEAEKYNLVVIRMDGSQEEYGNLSDDDVAIRDNFISININGAGGRSRFINTDTVKEFELFK